MNPMTRHIIMKRMHGDKARGYDSEMDKADYRRSNMDFAEDFANDFAEDFDEDFAEDFASDRRRGVKGTGRGRNRNRSRGRDRMQDFAGDIKLQRRDMSKWKHSLVNADGSHGPHFEAEDLMAVADKMNIGYDNYTENDLCMAANMLYSDFCKVLKLFIPQDKEIYGYVALAQAFLEDDDGLEGSEKLAAYFYCIADND